MNVGKSLLQVSRIAADNGLFVPSELTLLGKTLLQLDEVGRILDPAFDTSASVRRNATEIMSQRMGKNATQGSVLSSLLEMKDFVTGLPARLNKILDAVANAELEVKVRALDAKLVMEGLQKIANRIADGHHPRRADHRRVAADAGRHAVPHIRLPGPRDAAFLAAAAGGFWLVIGIFVQDRKSGKKQAG